MPMDNSATVFEAAWLSRAKATADTASWVIGVLDTIDGDGLSYLNTVRTWFNGFPHPTLNDRRALKTRLESFSDSDHLGGVNELSWWEFMRKTHLSAEPVATTNAPRPDFVLRAPTECYMEVSTLNVSKTDHETSERDEGVSLNHSTTLKRILLKAANDKRDQIAFGASLRQPSVLVLFDYTTWSWQGTQMFRFVANALLGQPFEFCKLPVDLSALVYVERKVSGGRIAISRDRSAAYYNPNATYPLPVGTFTDIWQFWCQMTESQPRLEDHWVWL
jgi:hypothetical protein